MAPHQEPDNAHSADQKRLRRHNRSKIIRTIVQLAALTTLVVYFAISVLGGRGSFRTGTSTGTLNGQPQEHGGEKGFIAISYPGLTRSKSLESKIVNVNAFEQQLKALRGSGYETITQQDILNYFFYNGSLPEKALFFDF